MKKRFPFECRITLIYIVIGALWILFSDRMLIYITQDPQRINIISIYKGWFYVAITGILLYFIVKREITKQKRLLDELLAANKKALESERLKSAFLSNLSHYIRTPMNSILGFTDLIQNQHIDEVKRERFLTVINEKSHHLLQTINNIVEISKIQEGQIVLKRVPLSIEKLLNKLMVIYESELTKKGSNVSLFKTIDLGTKSDIIVTDFDKLYYLLSNLINNAINYTKQGEIELGVKVENGSYIFYVKDTGTGIKPEMQKKLFINFLQIQSDLQSTHEGSGLGLFLSSKLADVLGGKLWLEYSNESGSLFCFKLDNYK